jgi:hypothetical protein
VFYVLLEAMNPYSLISIDHDRDWPVDKLKEVKVADALKHPNWNMGKKITVDSATLFNKVFWNSLKKFKIY